jgi:hypothetical protein
VPWPSSRVRGARQLVRLLRGGVTERADWQAILALANQAMITPRLSLVADLLPQDVRDFVDEICARNIRRNAMLLEQLSDAACALNAVGIVPLVIKGGACIARQGPTAPRMLSDLDLVVAPVDAELAIDSLVRAGFAVVMRSSHEAAHAVATLERPQDAGQIDLHRRPPGPPGFLSDRVYLDEAELINMARGAIRVPPPHLHIYFQAMHDQLHDQAYWRGGFDLRHAWDIADLIATFDVDWEALLGLPPTKHIANAVRSQLITCQFLTGARVPSAFGGSVPWLRARAHIVQHMAPRFAPTLSLLMLGLELPALLENRRHEREMRIRIGLPARASTPAQSLSRFLSRDN